MSLLSVLVAGCEGEVFESPLPISQAHEALVIGNFLESGGAVVIEAEHFNASATSRSHMWANSTETSASGSSVMAATPNSGTSVNTGYVTGSPRLDYKIRFVTTGTYYVWARGKGTTVNDDSCHVGIDGTGPASSDHIGNLPTSVGWVNTTSEGARATINVTSAGLHTLNLWMEEDGAQIDKILFTVNDSYTPSGAGPDESALVSASCASNAECDDKNPCTTDTCTTLGVCENTDNGACSNVFEVKDGILSMEAEHFSQNLAQANHSWEIADLSSASGGKVLVATPNNGAAVDTGYLTNSPRLDFAAYFPTVSAYYVWVRGIGPSGNDDTCHAGIDGKGPSTADRINGFSTGPTWSRSTMDRTPAVFNVTSPGVHIVNLWMREDGFKVDKIVLASSSSYRPSGAGPAESALSSGCLSDGACNDDNLCTNDICSNGLCTYFNNTSSCDDSNDCTTEDRCKEGVCAGTSGACYEPEGTYLVHPDESINMIVNLANFRTLVRDDTYGGFYTFISQDGTVTDTRKSFVTETRDAYAFVRAYMVTGDETYLDHADHALEFLYTYGWDATNGGWYFSTNRMGALSSIPGAGNYNTYKWCFIQHYALLGIAAKCEATLNSEDCDMLAQGRGVIDTKMWDPAPSQLGYYNRADLDFANPSGKGFTPTSDAMTTHAVLLDLMQPSWEHHQRLIELADIATDRLAASISLPQTNVGFAEEYNTDWSLNTNSPGGEMGHLLKTAWVLARAYLQEPDSSYRDAAKELIDEVYYHGGWNAASGVPYTNFNYNSGYINTGEIEYWQVEQAYTGGIMNWYIAQSPEDRARFLAMADTSLQFFADYMVDPVNGGGYATCRPDGSVLDGSKGNPFKAEYHSVELFYYAYLYGNLLYQRRPVSLYYLISPGNDARTLPLKPIAIEDDRLKISAVTLDGVAFNHFDSLKREIYLEADQGGELRVTFERVD
jgi:mannose/cellobiose epimerase-like protein (N-acyl-D-glucosamine 2-epimerase family)